MYTLAGHKFYEPDDYDYIDEILDFARKHRLLAASTDVEMDIVKEMVMTYRSLSPITYYANIIKTDILSSRHEAHWLSMLYSLGFKAYVTRICCMNDFAQDPISAISYESKITLSKMVNKKYLAIYRYSTIEDPKDKKVFYIFDEAIKTFMDEFPGSFYTEDGMIYIRYAPFADTRVVYKLTRCLHYLL